MRPRRVGVRGDGGEVTRVNWCLTSTLETIRLIRDGHGSTLRNGVGLLATGAQDGHLVDFHTAPELCVDGDDDDHDVELHVGLGCRLTYQGQTVTNAERHGSTIIVADST